MRRLAPYIVAAALPFAAAAQDDGGGFLERLIEDNLSGTGRDVQIEGFRGALSSEATLDRLTIADEQGVWLTLEGVTLDWNRGALLRGRLEVTELTASLIDMPRRPVAVPPDPELPEPEASGFRLPDLPVSVNIDRIAAERIALGAGVAGVAADLTLEGSLGLAGGSGAASLALNRIDGVAGRFALDAGFANETGQLDIALVLSEAPGGIVATLAKLPGAPSVDLELNGAGPLNAFSANLNLATDGAERLRGTLEIGAAEEGTDLTAFSADLGGDVTPLFAPDYREFFGQDIRLTLAGTRDLTGALRIDTARLRAAHLDISGQYEGAPGGTPTLIAVTGEIATPGGAPVLLPLPGPPTNVDRVDLDLSFDARESDVWTGRFDIAGLDRAGFSAARLGLDGTGRIQPGGAGFDADVAFAAEALDLGDPAAKQALGERVTGRLTLNAPADAPLEIEAFELNGESYGLSAEGTLDIRDRDLAVAVTAALSARDISAFSGLAGRPLSGAADLQVTGNGQVLGGSLDITAEGTTRNLSVGQPQADSLLEGQTTLSIEAVRNETGLELRRLRLTSDAARINAAARLGSDTSQLQVTAALVALETLVPGTSGPFSADLEASAVGPLWTLTLRTFGEALSANVAGDLDLSDSPRFDGRAALASPDIAPFAALAGQTGVKGGLDLSVEGEISADLAVLDLSGRVTGRDLVTGLAQVDPLLAGDITVSGAATRTGDTIDIAGMRITAPFAALGFDGAVDLSGDVPSVAGRLDATAPDLATFRDLAGLPGLSGSAVIQAEGRASVDFREIDLLLDASASDIRTGIAAADAVLERELRIDVDATRGNGEITVRHAEIETPALLVGANGVVGPRGGDMQIAAQLDDLGRIVSGLGGRASLVIDGRREDNAPWAITGIAEGPGGTEAALDGTVASDLRTMNMGLNGQLPLALANGFIAPRSLDGRAAFDLRIDGTPGLDAVSGVITTADARLVAPTLGLVIERTSGRVTLDTGRASIALGAEVQGGGQVGVDGGITLTAPFPGRIDARLNEVRLTDPQLYETTVSGTVSLDGALGGGASVTGRLALGRTEVRIPSGASGGVVPIPDITHVGISGAARRTLVRAGLWGDGGGNGSGGGGRPYPLDILIEAPNQIFIRGRGLDAELGGSLRIGGTSENVVPQGQFNLVRGRLDVLGKRLVLSEGAITLQGDFEPNVRLVALTNAEDVTVRIEIVGPATDPQIDFLSDPDLPQDEVVARLLFGRGIGSLSPLQAAQLAASVATLTGRGGDGLLGRLRANTGLDDLDITSDDEGNTAVRAGAYLSDNIYTDVTVGADGSAEIELNLDLTPSLTVTGRTNNDGETGIGLFFERDY